MSANHHTSRMRKHQDGAGGRAAGRTGTPRVPESSTGQPRAWTYRRGTAGHRPAFTLAELVVSMAVMSVLLVGLASAVLIASRSLPGPESRLEQSARTAAALDTIVEDLRLASWFLEHTDTATTFAVPDRNGDGRPERIRYAWSGTPGDPLTRQLNGGTVVNLLADVRQFSLALILRAEPETYPGQAEEEPVASVMGSYPVPATGPLGEDEDLTIDHLQQVSQFVEPILPPGAAGWRPARVAVVARNQAPATETLRVELREPGDGVRPSTTVLGGVSVPESGLPGSYAWRSIDFSGQPMRSPEAGVCVCFRGAAAAGSATALLKGDEEAGSAGDDTTFSTNGGMSWFSIPDQALQYELRGFVWLPGPEVAVTRHRATSVVAGVTAGPGPTSGASTTVTLLNEPELLSGLWEADFNQNPCDDRNGDGTPDFCVTNGLFDPASLVGGIWQANRTLQTLPPSDFAGLTTVRLRFRGTSAAMHLRLHADWSGMSCAVLHAWIKPDGRGGQTLGVSHQTDESTEELLTDVRCLTADFAELRLLIDPQVDLVHIRVNGIDRGTFGYARIDMSSADRFALLYPEVPGAGEVDDLSIHVAEGP